jgi:hypothetical protein
VVCVRHGLGVWGEGGKRKEKKLFSSLPTLTLARTVNHHHHPFHGMAPRVHCFHSLIHARACAAGKQVSKSLTKFKEAPSMLYVGGFEVEPMNELPKADYDAGWVAVQCCCMRRVPPCTMLL